MSDVLLYRILFKHICSLVVPKTSQYKWVLLGWVQNRSGVMVESLVCSVKGVWDVIWLLYFKTGKTALKFQNISFSKPFYRFYFIIMPILLSVMLYMAVFPKLLKETANGYGTNCFLARKNNSLKMPYRAKPVALPTKL